MMLPEFELINAADKSAALAVLAEPEGAKVIAGGTDLLVRMRRGETWGRLLDVSRIAELRTIKADESGVVIGGGVNHREVSSHSNVLDAAPDLACACSQVGSPQIRNRGTIGGNLANASPAADALPPLLIHRARVILESARGVREVNLEDFIVAPYQTSIMADELLCGVSLESLKGYRMGYRRVAKRAAWAISRLSAAWAVREERGVFLNVRLAIGSCTPMPFRAHAVEAFLAGKDKSAAVIAEAVNMVLEGIIFISGDRPSYIYKLPVLRGMLENILRG
ncbi:MAG: FAD binding domain-containing protein [Deltaproteobacteria bacterium]|nr:FAD binding domain-containing protein [Deltaproteobacteria bacterium]